MCRHNHLEVKLIGTNVTRYHDGKLDQESVNTFSEVEVRCRECGYYVSFTPYTSDIVTMRQDAVNWFYVVAENAYAVRLASLRAGLARNKDRLSSLVSAGMDARKIRAMIFRKEAEIARLEYLLEKA